MRVTSWSPVDAFLEHRAAPESQQALATDLNMSGLHGGSRSPFGAYDPAAIGYGAFNSTSSASGRHDAHAGVTGFTPDRLHGSFSSSASGPSASAGNLWRLMGLSRGHSAAAPSSTHTATHQPSSSKPSSSHAPSHSTSGHGPSTTTAPVILIGNDPTPVGGLIGGGSSGNSVSGTFPPVGGHSPTGGGLKLAATPEPASVLLLCTGLIGLAALIRRRRA
jgi:hypothetical protein